MENSRKPSLGGGGSSDSAAVIKGNTPKSTKDSKPTLQSPTRPGKNKSGKDILPYN